MATRRIAAVDIGTNTLLLLMVEVDDCGSVTVLHDLCRFGRIGQDVDQTNTLTPQAIERCLDVIRDYRSLIDTQQVDIVAAVGTQALREASNSQSFLAPAQELLGAPIEIIHGNREAQLVQLAVAQSLPALKNQSIVIADVGGGSTEVIICNNGSIHALQSIPIGSVRLAERCLQSDPPTPEQIAVLTQEIANALSVITFPVGAQLVGTAGTATTIAAVELKLNSYQPERIHGHRVSNQIVQNQQKRFFETPLGDRRKIPGLEPQRADVIAAGVAIYAHLLERLGGDMIVSDRGVRWGLAYELATKIAASA